MFGSKLRSWMEAVRPRKKQHRKDKQNKSSTNVNTQISSGNRPNRAVEDAITNGKRCHLAPDNAGAKQPPAPGTSSRYSANNLSSPESAYSTGYSTDGTSPGAPPDCYINNKTGVRYFSPEPNQQVHYTKLNAQQTVSCQSPRLTNVTIHQASPRPPNRTPEVELRVGPTRTNQIYPNNPQRLNEVIGSPVLTSPRQRNRIRTNPWVPGNNLSPGQIRQDMTKIVTSIPNSPISQRFLSPTIARNPMKQRSLSSSSCSSLSGSLHWEHKGNDSEDDCTLNEMMGKYDESYVYEKETDILSDSDPTDCDTDIDTGQDGGDEDDPLEGEFDFIDNGSYLEVDLKENHNTGHCTYYNFEVQRRASRRRTTRRSKQSERRRRSSSNKKRHKPSNLQMDGSKSAGATPLSVRRTRNHPVSKLALEDCLKKRSNSVSFSRYPTSTIDKRDKEADRKYKELIVEAEHILRSMKTTGLSPRRVPGPTNKRVEILRSTECAKPDIYGKNRLIEEHNPQYSKLPSSNFSPRFSPKKNHITNFINNNSPVLLRRENELPKSPLATPRKLEEQRNFKSETNRRSPKYKKKIKAPVKECSTSSDSEMENAKKDKNECPQSEPVRRKVYGQGKTVAFNLNCNETSKYREEHKNHRKNNILDSSQFSPTHHLSTVKEYKFSTENLRQQVLLNTIANLKRSLEDQSASLKQVVRSSHNIHI